MFWPLRSTESISAWTVGAYVLGAEADWPELSAMWVEDAHPRDCGPRLGMPLCPVPRVGGCCGPSGDLVLWLLAAEVWGGGRPGCVPCFAEGIPERTQ